MTPARRAPALAAAVLALAACGAAAQEGAPSRPSGADDPGRGLRPDDLFRMEEIGRVRVSPEGDRVAFEHVRAGGRGERKRLSLFSGTRSDVRVARLDGGGTTRLTDGAETGTGWFRPRWSPDGERLALLSVRGEEVRPWVWNSATGKLRRLADRGVHMYLGRPTVFRWADRRTVVFAAWPEGRRERGRMQAEDMRPGSWAARRWRASWSGREATVSVLDAGEEAGPADLPDREIVAVDVASGRAEVVARGAWGHVTLSPDARRAAVFGFSGLAAPPRRRPVGLSLLRGTELRTIGVLPPDGRGPGGGTGRRGSDAATGPTPAGSAASGPGRLDAPDHGTLRWSPDGRRYAVLGGARRPGGDDAGPDGAEGRRSGARPSGDRTRRVLVLGAADGGRRTVDLPDREPTGLAWTGDARLLVRTEPASGEGSAGRGEGAGPRWWLAEADGDLTPVTDVDGPAPGRLVRAGDGATVGADDGELWRISPAGGARSLTRGFAPPVRRIVWPPPDARRGVDGGPRRPGDPLVVSAGDGDDPELWIVDPGRDEASPVRLATLRPEAELRAFSPETRTAVVLEADSTGTGLVTLRPGPGDGPERRALFRANRWLRGIRAGGTRSFTYRSLEGRELTGWVLLPVGHREGDRPPLVTWVYPGMTHGQRRPRAVRLNRASPVSSLQLLAARGYAVLLPSMPLPPPGTTADPRERMLGGVMPAVDSAVAMGVADPDRLGVMGHSYGGYSVYHIVSLTDRFRAAVASAGPTDLASFYGTFDQRSRYGHMHHPLLGQVARMAWMESGQGRMGVPPWEAPERYRRNSPLRHVAEVETPLMMIHGDQDFVPIQQAEAFFTALQRRGERARLVRYFGEGHTAFGRANVLDRWDRIIGWFRDHLR